MSKPRSRPRRKKNSRPAEIEGNGSNGGAHDDNEATYKFPQIVALVRKADAAGLKADGYLWSIGDALIAECGSPGRHGVNTGSKTSSTR